MQYGCIGEHLTHSFSTEIHAALADYDYRLQEIAPDALPAFMQTRDFRGINVTIPYKQAVIPFLQEIDDAARTIGAVNTILNRDGLLYGYNTDFYGMLALITRTHIPFTGKKVLILGTGGTSATAFAVAKHLGAAEIYKVSRTEKNGAISYETAKTVHADADILINTTPCGMFAAAAGMPIDPAVFPQLSGVIDAIYHPLRTPLVLCARARDIPAVGGLYMLVAQAVKACEYFTGHPFDAGQIERVYRQIRLQKENIVLTGMPGSGKTTVGKRLAEKLHRPFFDTDVLIEQAAGMPITAIFATEGEAAFRKREAAVIADISQQTGAVIATGGGAVLRQENIEALRQNGRLVFLNRPLEQLIPTADRPLANTVDAIFARYRERFPLYLTTADDVIAAGDTPDMVADAVERSFFNENPCD